MATSLQPFPGRIQVGAPTAFKIGFFGALGVAAFAVILYTILGVVLALLYSAGALNGLESLLPR